MIDPNPLRPPRSLAERLEQLNDTLQSLGDQLKEAIAAAIGTTVAQAVRDAIRGLLGESAGSSGYPPRSWQDDPPWHERSWQEWEPDRWSEQNAQLSHEPSRPRGSARNTSLRWQHALGTALQTSLFWLRQQKSRRPVLTGSLVALTAGLTAFYFGPAAAAGVGLLASWASLILTAEGASAAAERLAALAAS